MRLLLLFFMGLLMALPSQAQDRIRNVRVRTVDGSQVEIRYDLTSTQPGDSVYIEIRSRLRGSVPVRLEFVRGDVGIHISAGTDRRIVWDALANGYPLNEEIQARVFLKTGVFPTAAAKTASPASATTTPAVTEKTPEPTAVVKTSQTRRQKRKQAKASVFAADSATVESAPSAPVVITTPAPAKVDAPVSTTVSPAATAPIAAATPAVADTVKLPKPKTRYNGPAWALLSVVAPGIGNIFVQTPKPKIGFRPLLTIACYGLVAYGLSERKQAQDAYAIYEAQKNIAEGAPYYQTANDHHHKYFLATRGAMVAAAADVVLTFIKGLRNQRLQKEASRYQGFSIRPGVQVGQPTAVLRYSF